MYNPRVHEELIQVALHKDLLQMYNKYKRLKQVHITKHKRDVVRPVKQKTGDILQH